MTPPSLADFRAEFPEFAATADATVQYWLDKSSAYLSQGNWGECWPEAVLFHAAHSLALSLARAEAGGTTPAGSGPLTSASVGGVSVGYGMTNRAQQANRADTLYASTPYGQSYLGLRETCLGSGQLTGTIARTVG